VDKLRTHLENTSSSNKAGIPQFKLDSTVSGIDSDRLKFLTSRDVSDAHGVLKLVKRDPVLTKRLDRVMHGDKIVQVDKTYFDDCFRKFTDLAPQWSPDANDVDSVVNIFWARYSSEWRQKVLIIRQQSSGLCYLNAVFVFEHYMVAILGGNPVTTTYDVGKYEAETLKGGKMVKFILTGKICSTQETLQTLCRISEDQLNIISLPLKPDKNKIMFEEGCETILREVANQPAILAQVKATHMANSTDQVIFTEPPGPQPLEPRHAMVIVGARKDKKGEYYFLVQSWWENRYFLELSGRYLASCDARVIFLDTSKLERNPDYQDLLNDAIFAESCSDVSDICLE
jgi:hypothetical protein